MSANRESLTSDELSFIRDVFTTNVEEVADSELAASTDLSLTGDVPQNLQHLLSESKLTLLAEIKNYQLWFPFKIEMSENGEFRPVLGVPEVVDKMGDDRPWRISDLRDVSVICEETNQEFNVVSLSSNGIAINTANQAIESMLTSSSRFTLKLPGHGAPIELKAKPVRYEGETMAAEFLPDEAPSERLRRFIFDLHRKKYNNLYAI